MQQKQLSIKLLQELLEIVTWAQLGFIKKPVAVLNVDGYYDDLLNMFDHAVKEGFIKSSLREIVISGSNPIEVLDKLSAYKGRVLCCALSRD